jgi:hypothetical protein
MLEFFFAFRWQKTELMKKKVKQRTEWIRDSNFPKKKKELYRALELGERVSWR